MQVGVWAYVEVGLVCVGGGSLRRNEWRPSASSEERSRSGVSYAECELCVYRVS